MSRRRNGISMIGNSNIWNTTTLNINQQINFNGDGDSSKWIQKEDSNGDFVLLKDSTIIQTITSTGNVGIGVEIPSELLQVGSSSSSGDIYIKVNSANDQKSGIKYVGAGVEIWHTSHNDATNVFQIGLDSSEYMTFDNIGNVGIGIINPSEKLHISDGKFRMNFDNNSKGICWTEDISNNRFQLKGFNSSKDSGNFKRFMEWNIGDGGGGIHTGDRTSFYNWSDDALTETEVMRIEDTSIKINKLMIGNIGSIPLLDLSIGDADTGLNQEGENELAMYTNNVERMRINADGNVNINNNLTVVGDLGITGDLTVVGEIISTGPIRSISVGQLLNSDFLYHIPLGATTFSGNPVTLFEHTYTCISSNSKIMITFDCSYRIDGTGSDSFLCRLQIDGITHSTKTHTFVEDTGGGTRSNCLYPITGIFVSSNSATGIITISSEIQRVYGDDTLTILSGGGNNLIIQEIAI